MNKGEIIKIHYLAETAQAQVLESERYNKAWIVGYKIIAPNTGKIALATVFPDYPYLPPVSTETFYYNPPPAYIEWRDHWWVAPVGLPSGTGRRLDFANPVDFAKRRIDFIHELVKWYGMSEDMILVPGTDGEWKAHRKWWPRF